MQKPDEKVIDFVALLRKLSEHCNFGDTLDDILRDRLGCGCKDKALQCKLLAEPELTFDSAFKMATATESAKRDASDLQTSAESIHAVLNAATIITSSVSSYTSGNSLQTCYPCRGKHFSGKSCFRLAICKYCKKTGHIAIVCHSKAHDQKGAKPPSKPFRGTHHITNDLPELEVEYQLFHLPMSRSQPIRALLSLNSVLTVMEIDTGVALSIISSDTYGSMFAESAPPLRASHSRLKTYMGEAIHTEGEITAIVNYWDKSKELPLTVVVGSGPSLFGRHWLNHFTLDWHSLNCVSSPSNLQSVPDSHVTLFDNDLGLLKDVTVQFQVDTEVQPRFFRARTVPYALRGKVEDELNRLAF